MAKALHWINWVNVLRAAKATHHLRDSSRPSDGKEWSRYSTAPIALVTIRLTSESMFSVNGPGRKYFWASPPS